MPANEKLEDVKKKAEGSGVDYADLYTILSEEQDSTNAERDDNADCY